MTHGWTLVYFKSTKNGYYIDLARLYMLYKRTPILVWTYVYMSIDGPFFTFIDAYKRTPMGL